MSAPQKMASTCADRKQWPAILRETVAEVFSTMASRNIIFSPDVVIPSSSSLTGMVGIAGPLSATLSLRCTLETARLITSHMLRVRVEEGEAQKLDAVGEICNVVAGYFKAKVGYCETCVLSLPAVIIGNNYKICSVRKDLQIKLPFSYETEILVVTLDIRP